MKHFAGKTIRDSKQLWPRNKQQIKNFRFQNTLEKRISICDLNSVMLLQRTPQFNPFIRSCFAKPDIQIICYFINQSHRQIEFLSTTRSRQSINNLFATTQHSTWLK